MRPLTIALTLVISVVVRADDNPIYDATTYQKLVMRVPNGVLYTVHAPDTAALDVAHVFGSPYERGRAHGQLLSARLLAMVEVQLPKFYAQEVASLADQLDKLPKWLAAAIRKLLPYAEKEAPKMFSLALGWLEGVQRKYNNASASNVYEEIEGMAYGACEVSHQKRIDCDTSAVRDTLRQVNVLPDLIRMQCSMMGGWGVSTAPGKSLIQLRTLDFGPGPFANNSCPVGIVTGISPHVSLSEKVNDIHGGGTPPGSYHGQATAYVIRDIVEFATTKEEAYQMALAATRTWGVWLGVGDAVSQRFIAMEYMRASVTSYDDLTLPALTGQQAIPSVAYIDKHPQPSDDTTLATALLPLAGSITADLIAAKIPRITRSGDVHIAVYDFTPNASQALFSVGTTDANGTYTGIGGRNAWAAPFVRFSLDSLWNEKLP